MNKEAQRISIAEWCGRIYSYYHTDKGFLYGSNEGQVGRFKIPDYLNDLNAMHSAVKSLDDHYMEVFGFHLQEILGCYVVGVVEDYKRHMRLLTILANATAEQRAEALLKTIGRWEDESEQA